MPGPVETAIRRTVSQGQRLSTPDIHRSAPFEVGRINHHGMALLFGRKRTLTTIPWACLEGIPLFLQGKGWVEIRTVYDIGAKPNTLDGYLKGWVNRGTAGWVAVVLERAGIVEIDRSRPMRVRSRI